MTTTVTTPTADRQLLAEVSQWRKDNGWTDTTLGWVDDLQAVRVRPLNHGFDLWRRTSGGNWQMFPTYHAAEDFAHAVDQLVAFRVLPARFSSMYRAGLSLGYVNGYAAGRDDFLEAVAL